MLLQYIIRKIHVIPICENIIISFEKFHVTQYMRKYDHELKNSCSFNISEI
jgi:hypothetical protein